MSNLSDKQWDRLTKRFLISLINSMTSNRGDATKIAKSINKTVAYISQMKENGKGTVITWMRVVFVRAGLSDTDIKGVLEEPEFLFKKLTKPSVLEVLFERVKGIYSEQELVALFRVIISKKTVEEYLSLKEPWKNKKLKKKK